MIKKFFPFMKNAGDYAIANRPVPAGKMATVKDVEQVRCVESQIVKMFSDFCEKEFSDCDYFIATESFMSDKNFDVKKSVSEHEYMFVITPIDGNDQYAHKFLVGWTINIAVWRRGVPKYGMIYNPMNMNRLVYNDDVRAYKVYHAFSENEKKEKFIGGVAKKFFIMNALDRPFENGLYWDAASTLLIYVTVYDFAYFAHGTLWRLGPLLPIVNAVGVQMYDIKTWKKFRFDMLGDDLRMVNGELFCNPEHLEFVKNNTKYLDGVWVAKDVDSIDEYQRQSTLELPKSSF